MSSGVQRTMVGSFIGTGAAALQILTVGFKPRRVKLTNVTHPGTLVWYEGMPAASGLKEVTNGTKSYITTLGITQLVTGFQLDLDTAINQAGDLIFYEASE